MINRARIGDSLLEATIVGSFTSIGYDVRRRLSGWGPPADPAVAGSTIALSGATGGLGGAGARQLAAAGARLRLLVRNRERGQALVDELAAETGNDDIRLVVADLSELDQVRQAARQLQREEPHLDVLIHNAGVLHNEYAATSGGVERTLATHLLGPWLLTRETRGLLAAARRGRIIWMSSGGMYTQQLRLDELELTAEDYKGATAYARAKRAQVELTRMLAVPYAEDGTVVHALHPGWADTAALTDGLPGFASAIKPLLRTPEQGADTMVWLASADEPLRSSGDFWLDRRRRGIDYLPWTRAGREDADGLVAWLDARIERADSAAQDSSDSRPD